MNHCKFCGSKRRLEHFRENKAGGFKALTACRQCVTGIMFMHANLPIKELRENAR